VFSCIAYVHVPDELRTKLDPKAKKCVFIGYSLKQKRYMCYNPSTSKWGIGKDVVTNKLSIWYVDEKNVVGDDANDNVVV